MTTDGSAGGAFGEQHSFSGTSPTLVQQIILRVTENAGGEEQERIASVVEHGMEEARRRLAEKRAEQKRRKAIEEQQREHLRLIQLEEEEAERKKSREAQRARNKTKSMGR
jgi:hypothetical protein